jgi:hypothetical protein
LVFTSKKGTGFTTPAGIWVERMSGTGHFKKKLPGK